MSLILSWIDYIIIIDHGKIFYNMILYLLYKILILLLSKNFSTQLKQLLKIQKKIIVFYDNNNYIIFAMQPLN